jgi:hypothetical protein
LTNTQYIFFLSEFKLFISQDCYGTTQEYVYRTWFYFGVFGASDVTLRLQICNMNNQLKSFEDGYKIVYRSVLDTSNNEIYSEDSYYEDEEYKWKRLESNISANVTNFF